MLLLQVAEQAPFSVPGWFGWVPIAAALIVIWRFAIRRPILRLEVTECSTTERDGIVTIFPRFHIVNTGWGVAEDVHIEFELPHWNFDRDADKEYPSTPLGIKSEFTSRIGVPGEVGQMFVGNTIAGRSSFRIYIGKAELEKRRPYSMNYTISCKSHGARPGKIEFYVDYANVKVESTNPSVLRELRKKLKALLSSVVSVSTTSVWHDSVRVEITRSTNSDELEVDTVIWAAFEGGPRLGGVGSHITLFDGEDRRENEITTITSGVEYIEHGDIWSLEQRRWIAEPEGVDPHEITWRHSYSYDYDTGREVPPGVKLVEYELTGTDPHRIPVVKGKIRNTNSKSEAVEILVKLYSPEGVVADTQNRWKRIQGRSTANFRINVRSSEDCASALDSCEVFLRR